MSAEENVKLAFDAVRNSALILEVTEQQLGFTFREAAQSLRRQEDAAWFTDPTMMIQPGAKEDIERKIAILDTAANFLKRWNDIKTEALAAAGTE